MQLDLDGVQWRALVSTGVNILVFIAQLSDKASLERPY
jgi:hypothetical protein